MLLMKPVTVSRGFSDIVVEERQHLTTDIQTETRLFLGHLLLSVLCVEFFYYENILSRSWSA